VEYTKHCVTLHLSEVDAKKITFSVSLNPETWEQNIPQNPNFSYTQTQPIGKYCFKADFSTILAFPITKPL
jgi:hypothetical protein